MFYYLLFRYISGAYEMKGDKMSPINFAVPASFSASQSINLCMKEAEKTLKDFQ